MSVQLDKPWQKIIDQVAAWARINSPWAIHYNSGSCNGCDIEILAALTPRYDVERLGVTLHGSPRHADVLICTGPVTRQSRERLQRIYEQMPEPKFVIAVGSCALSGGIFHNCYNCMGGIEEIIPVDVFVPGCPPRPEAVIDGVVKLLQKLDPNIDPEKLNTELQADLETALNTQPDTEPAIEKDTAHGSNNGKSTTS